MLAVIAAMLFIGIVTAAMLKNTGSQATASGSYSTMHIMSSTVRSGMIATETYFRTANNNSAVLTAVNNYLSAEKSGTAADTYAKSFVIGNSQNKRKLGEGQYFSSRIIAYDRDNSLTAAFEIKSGRKEKGKGIKTARAYYKVENGTITGDIPFPGSNAFSATGNAEMKYGNAGFKIYGHATFENDFKTQNETPIEFYPDEKGEGSLYIKGKADILNSKGIYFGVNTFFEDNVRIQNATARVFQKSVGFNGDVGSDKPVSVDGDVWINGDFMQNMKSFNIEAKGTGPQTINITEKLSLLEPDDPRTTSLTPPCCPSVTSTYQLPPYILHSPSTPNGRDFNSGCIPDGTGEMDHDFDANTGYGTLTYWTPSGICVWQMPVTPHSSQNSCSWTCKTHKLTASEHRVKSSQLSGFNNVEEYLPKYIDKDGKKCEPIKDDDPDCRFIFPNVDPKDPDAIKAAVGSDMLTKLNMKPFEERGEPDLDITAGKTFLTISKDNVLDAGGNLLGNNLQDFYNATHNNPQYAQYYDNGHLLLNIPNNTNVPCGGGEFNGKVIFNVQGTLDGRTAFYSSSGTSASTLIYVRETGKLNQFGVGENGGNFSGLIYVDPKNTQQQTFSWGNNTTLNGAVILKGGDLTWNSNNSSTTSIRRDPNVLKNYGFLIDGADIDNQQVELIDSSKGLILHPIGYYFY